MKKKENNKNIVQALNDEGFTDNEIFKLCMGIITLLTIKAYREAFIKNNNDIN